MRRLHWSDSSTAAAPPRVRVERFCGKSSKRHRVHLLGEMRCKKTHYRFGENTMPCLAPEQCPFCADLAWKMRFEFFGPALDQDPGNKVWVPIIAVLTQGAWNKLAVGAPGAHRGRLLDVWRVQQGSARVLQVKELGRVEPLMPSFDIEPHLLRMWFPNDGSYPPAEIPAPIPFTAEELHRPLPVAEPMKLTPEQKAAVDAKAAALREKWGISRDAEAAEPAPAAAPPATPAPTPAAKPSMTPTPAKALSAIDKRIKDGTAADKLRRQAAKEKAANELTPAEAVEFGRVADYVLGLAPAADAIRNGKKGGTN